MFPQPTHIRRELGNSYQASEYARNLGGCLIDTRNGSYALSDFDWPGQLTEFWAGKAKQDPGFYAKVLALALEHHTVLLKKNFHVTFRRSYGSFWSDVDSRPAVPCGWARYFAQTPCLRSQSGDLKRPTELYVAKPSTLPLINAGEPSVAADVQERYGDELLSVLGCRPVPPKLSEFNLLFRAELDGEKPSADRIYWLLVAANSIFAASDDDPAKDRFLSALADRKSIPSAQGELERPDHLVQDAGEEMGIAVVSPTLRGSPIIAALGIRQSPSRASDVAWIDAEIDLDAPLPREKLRKLRRLLSQPSSVSEHLWGQNRWLSLDGAVRSLDQFAFKHSAIKELPAENLRDGGLLSSTADFGVIAPLPKELMSFSKPELLSCLEGELLLSGKAGESDADWLTAISQVLWTEAETTGEHQQVMEAAALQWRNAQVVLDPDLSRRFTLSGYTVADGIDIDAGWTSPECLAIRAEDEDEVCEITEQIARRLREQLGTARTKTGSKISSWIARQKGQIEKLGLKALSVGQLRSWPEEASGSAAKREDDDTSVSGSGSTKADSSVSPESIEPLGDEGDTITDTQNSIAHGIAERRDASAETSAHGSNTEDSEEDTDAPTRTNLKSRYRGHRGYAIKDMPRRHALALLR